MFLEFFLDFFILTLLSCSNMEHQAILAFEYIPPKKYFRAYIDFLDCFSNSLDFPIDLSLKAVAST